MIDRSLRQVVRGKVTNGRDDLQEILHGSVNVCMVHEGMEAVIEATDRKGVAGEELGRGAQRKLDVGMCM